MKIDRSLQIEMPAADVFEMSVLQEYQEQKCRDAGALSWEIDVHRDGDTAVVRTKRKMPTIGFPGLLRKFVPTGVTSTETVTWGPAASDGARTAQLHVDFHGAPASMKGTVRVVPTSDTGATVVVDAEFVAHIPLVGRKVEGFAAPIILTVIDSEQQTARNWIADRPS